ncbi:MAG: hypothetical protein ACYDC1_22825 [Limisphaerales bacterium]
MSNKTKIHTIALAFGLASAAMSAELTLAWDPSTTPGITNHVLYASRTGLSSTNLTQAIVRVSVGTNLTASVHSLGPGPWAFAVTAMKNGVESDPSNILQVEVPTPPARMRTVVLQYSGTISNWTDVGFFKLRLP